MTRKTLIQNTARRSLILGLTILIVFFAEVKKENRTLERYSSLPVKENRDGNGWELVTYQRLLENESRSERAFPLK